MLAFSNDYYGMIFRATQSVELFCAYLSDSKNLMLLAVGMVWQRLDGDIFKYIDMPAGTKLIRISSDEFEIDKNTKEIYMEKRE